MQLRCVSRWTVCIYIYVYIYIAKMIHGPYNVMSPPTITSSWCGAEVIVHTVNLPFTLICYGREEWEFKLRCR